MGHCAFLILLVMRHYGVASAASDKVQRNESWRRAVGRRSCEKRLGWKRRQRKVPGKEKEEPELHAKAIESSEVHPIEWLCDGC